MTPTNLEPTYEPETPRPVVVYRRVVPEGEIIVLFQPFAEADNPRQEPVSLSTRWRDG